jgi:hypothetical protein
MSVTLSPVSPRYTVSDADDPFKKYWWAILLGIGFTALWLLTPMLGEKSVGSTVVDTGRPKTDAGVEQSLGPDAAAGGAMSMDGTGSRRKEDGPLGSSLYQAPPEEAVAATNTPAPGATLADALKKVSDGDGGWDEKAQKGFSAPKLSGGSLSGMGAASGGRAGSASGGTGAFGSRNANVGYANTQGLSSGGANAPAASNSKGMAALKAATAQSLAAAGNSSNDGARSSLSRAFDGAKSAGKIGGDGAALSGNYAALDSAPVNLKVSEHKLNDKKFEAPPAAAADAGASAMDASAMGKEIAMQVAGAVLGQAIGGPVGGIVTNVIMQAIQRQMDQEQKVRDLENEQRMNETKRKIG